MTLQRNKKLLARLTKYNELLIECDKRIHVANMNYKEWKNPKDVLLQWVYSESEMLNDIRRYENLYIYLEKKFNQTLEKL